MSAGDSTMLKKFRDPIVAMSAWAGTTIYLVTKGGQLHSYTISGGADAEIAHIRGDVKCMYTDLTTIYFGMGDGRLLSYTISDKSNSELKRYDSAIVTLNILSTILYVGTADGRLHQYEIS